MAAAAPSRLALLETLLDLLDDAIVVHDAGGEIVYRNRAARVTDVTTADSEAVLIKQAVLAPFSNLTARIHSNPASSSLVRTVMDAQEVISIVRTAHPRRHDPTAPITHGLEFISHAYCALVGKREKELLGSGWVDVVHPDDLPAAIAFCHHLETADTVAHFEHRVRVSGASAEPVYKWIHVVLSPLRNAHGVVTKWMGYGADIDELKCALAARAEERQLLDTLMDQLPVGVAVAAAPAGNLIKTNKRIVDMFPALDTAPDVAHFHRTHRTQVLDAHGTPLEDCDLPLTRVLRTGHSIKAEPMSMVHLDTGALKHFRVWATPLLNGKGDIIAAAVVAENTTHEMQVEQERSYREAANRLLSNASHELRTPLNGILGNCELLGHTSLDSEQSELVACILDCGRLLLLCVNDLLDFQRLAAGKLRLEALPVCPSEVAASSAAVVAGSAASKGLQLVVDVEACRHVTVLADPQRLKQIFLNLLSNSVRYTQAGTISMTCTACECDDSSATALLRFTVADTGIGIDADTLARLWTPFMQGDSSTTRRYGGTGLGLSIVSTLASLMGGETGVDSTEGEGSTFWFTVRLPLAADQPQAAGAVGCTAGATTGLAVAAHAPAMRPLPDVMPSSMGASSSSAVCSGAAACTAVTAAVDRHHAGDSAAGSASAAGNELPARRPTVLVAEDNAANLLVIKRMLQRLGYGNILVAVNGKEAVQAVAGEAVDIVLMDCHMDVMDGFEACRWIRLMEEVHKRHVPVLAVTASALEPDRLACHAAGMDDVITKPLSIAALRDALQRYLPPHLVQRA